MDTIARTQRGFTLIELMIVVAIIAILSAIALPAYNDYVTRSQVSESMSLFAGVRTALTEYGSNTSTWPAAIRPPLATVSGTEITGTLTGRYAEMSNTVSGTYPGGVVTVTMTSGQANTETILFETADGGFSWSCNTGTLTSKYRPQACR